jgi:hypothetical protein
VALLFVCNLSVCAVQYRYCSESTTAHHVSRHAGFEAGLLALRVVGRERPRYHRKLLNTPLAPWSPATLQVLVHIGVTPILSPRHTRNPSNTQTRHALPAYTETYACVQESWQLSPTTRDGLSAHTHTICRSPSSAGSCSQQALHPTKVLHTRHAATAAPLPSCTDTLSTCLHRHAAGCNPHTLRY